MKELYKLVESLADQVDFLRFQLTQTPHLAPTATAVNPAKQIPAALDGPKFLSEEEEDLLALRLSEYIDDTDVRRLTEQLRVVPQLEPNE